VKLRDAIGALWPSGGGEFPSDPGERPNLVCDCGNEEFKVFYTESGGAMIVQVWCTKCGASEEFSHF